MARNEDTQADAPDLGASVQLENSETLDGPPGGDALDAGYVPPDRPYALDEDDVTGSGMRAGDTLDERLAREVPEQEAVDPDRAGRVTGAVGEDATAAVDVGVDGGAASAEEAAVHHVDVDTRVDGEPSVAGDPMLADPEVEDLLADEAGDVARADAARDAADVLDR